MDDLQNEIAAEYPDSEIQIIGINGAGHESGVATATDGRDLPFLQDRDEVDVSTLWDVVYRDVIILDTQNKYYTTYNLTSNDLSESDNVAALKAKLLAAAGLN